MLMQSVNIEANQKPTAIPGKKSKSLDLILAQYPANIAEAREALLEVDRFS